MSSPIAGLRARIALSPTMRGILWMVISTGFFAAMHATVRFVSQDVHPFELAFFRNVFGFLVFLPWILRTGFIALHTNRFGMHAARASINTISMLCWFTALSMMPLADATAINLSGPLFVTLGAIVFLGEKVRARRWTALAIGAVGTLIVIRPGFADVSLGAILVIVTSATVAGSKLCAKSLSRTDSPAAIVAYLAMLMTPLTLVPAIFVWEWPTLEQYGWFALIGFFGSMAHYCTVRAYKHADVSLVEPVIFVRLVWAALLGYLLFAEIPTIWVWIGGALTVASTTYIARREAAQRATS